jgi:hypothetical protein
MKFAINNKVFDTENIFSISEISSDTIGHIYHKFTINFFHRKEEDVEIYSGTYYDGEKYSSIGKRRNRKCVTDDCISNNTTGTLQDCESSPIYKETLQEITELREELIEFWDKGRSTLKQFTIGDLF